MSISVVIASYNHAPYLRESIESVLAQTLTPHEVIVVDDGSTDDSPAIIRSYGERIRPVFQANGGTAAALNAGAALTSGEWIAFQNSDDEWEPVKLEQQMSIAALDSRIGLIHTGWACIDAAGVRYEDLPANANLPDYSGPPVAEMQPTMLRSMPVVISSAAVSRRAWEEVGAFDERYHGLGDWDLCVRMSERYLFGFVDRPLTLVRKHAANASTDSTRIPEDWTARDWRFLGLETLPRSALVLYDRARAGAVPIAEAAFALACLGTIHSWGSEPRLARAAYRLATRLAPGRPQTYLRYLVTFLPQRLRTRIR